MSRCHDCGYFWCDEGDNVPRCHFEGAYAPCEEDDNNDYEERMDTYIQSIIDDEMN